MNKRKIFRRIIGFLLINILLEPTAMALRANRVWVQRHPKLYRVIVQYTLPEIKSLRYAQIDFKNPAKAKKFYIELLRGVEFYLDETTEAKFIQNPGQPSSW